MPARMIQRSLIVALLTASATAAPAKGSFSFYNLQTPLAGPCDLDTGPDGAIWGDTFLANKFIRVDPKTGVLTEYDIPYTGTPAPLPNDPTFSTAESRIAFACVVRTGKDGKVYGATGIRNQVARIDPYTKKVEVFDSGLPQDPTGNLQPFNDMWPGETGMWFSMTSANKLCLFDYKTTKSVCYSPPTAGAGTLGMIIGSDKAVWTTEMLASKIGRFDPKTKSWTEYPLPPDALLPTVIRVEYLGKIWWTNFGTGNQGSIDIKTKEIKTYTNPAKLPTTLPTENTLDRQGRIWFSTLTDNTLNYYIPKTNTFGGVPVPGSILSAGGVSVVPNGEIGMHYDYATNAIWFTGLRTNYVGRYQL